MDTAMAGAEKSTHGVSLSTYPPRTDLAEAQEVWKLLTFLDTDGTSASDYEKHSIPFLPHFNDWFLIIVDFSAQPINHITPLLFLQ